MKLAGGASRPVERLDWPALYGASAMRIARAAFTLPTQEIGYHHARSAFRPENPCGEQKVLET
jgi:hypothetical protein